AEGTGGGAQGWWHPHRNSYALLTVSERLPDYLQTREPRPSRSRDPGGGDRAHRLRAPGAPRERRRRRRARAEPAHADRGERAVLAAPDPALPVPGRVAAAADTLGEGCGRRSTNVPWSCSRAGTSRRTSRTARCRRSCRI